MRLQTMTENCYLPDHVYSKRSNLNGSGHGSSVFQGEWIGRGGALRESYPQREWRCTTLIRQLHGQGRRLSRRLQ
jgi:hypothetical protein